MESGPRPRAQATSWGLAAFAVALLVRVPTLRWPVLGDGAVLATWAEVLGREQAFTVPGTGDLGPLLPTLLAVPVAAGVSPTLALRLLLALTGALLAPLTGRLARRLGCSPGAARTAALLVAIHPGALLLLGGVIGSGASLATLLVLVGALGAASQGRRRRWLGLLGVGLAPLAAPSAVAWVVPLGLLGLLRERSTTARLLLGGLLVAALVLGIGRLGVDAGSGPWLLALGLLVVGAPLLVLVPDLPRGLGRGLEAAPRTRAALHGGAFVHLVLLAVAPGGSLAALMAPAAPVGILLLVAAVAGAADGRGRRRRRLAPVLAAVGVAFLLLAPTWSLLAPARPAVARRARLALAMDLVREAAGDPDGGAARFAVAAGALGGHEARRLADLAGGLPTHALVAEAGGLLPPVPWDALGSGERVLWLGPVGSVAPVETYGGATIVEQSIVGRAGPWMVVAARRP